MIITDENRCSRRTIDGVIRRLAITTRYNCYSRAFIRWRAHHRTLEFLFSTLCQRSLRLRRTALLRAWSSWYEVLSQWHLKRSRSQRMKSSLKILGNRYTKRSLSFTWRKWIGRTQRIALIKSRLRMSFMRLLTSRIRFSFRMWLDVVCRDRESFQFQLRKLEMCRMLRNRFIKDSIVRAWRCLTSNIAIFLEEEKKAKSIRIKEHSICRFVLASKRRTTVRFFLLWMKFMALNLYKDKKGI